MKVLILNSDSPVNRGDRAILQGLISLIRDTLGGDAESDLQITALSQFAERDEAWFGIRFLPFSPYSISPVHYLRLLAEAAQSDLVLFGGGELLKDYTNKLSLFYWLLKIWGIRRVNKNLLGAFQGIGPTGAGISRWAIRHTVNQCREFLVRDAESAEKLALWGVRTKVTSSFDPAVYLQHDILPPKRPRSAAAKQQAAAQAENDNRPIGLGLRRWFHYRTGGWLPARFRVALAGRMGRSQELKPTAKELAYMQHTAQLADSLIERFDAPVVFFAMHLGGGEDDAGFARAVVARMRHADRTRILAADDCSPSEFLTRVADCRVFVASRLHSAILASVAQVPAVCLYYVDKGRLFFEQLGLAKFSRPIEELLDRAAVAELTELASLADRERVKLTKTQQQSLGRMREQLRGDFQAALTNIGLNNA
jgi:polysaccharide pyruvyl transferase WcaK-like protein